MADEPSTENGTIAGGISRVAGSLKEFGRETPTPAIAYVVLWFVMMSVIVALGLLAYFVLIHTQETLGECLNIISNKIPDR